jgi:hypothetical protein
MTDFVEENDCGIRESVCIRRPELVALLINCRGVSINCPHV